MAEAEAADTSGWGFGWLKGRATEERPPWGFARLLGARLGQVSSALDIDTGGGEVVAETTSLPPKMVVTEGWSPNARRARASLGPRGVHVVETRGDGRLPFPDEAFELVSSRHPVRPNWAEIHRVLEPGGCYFAQHVGPTSAFALVESIVGELPDEPSERDPDREVAAAERAGLVVEELRRARCRMEFYDIGAVVWILRRCVWWVPDFTVDRYQDKLLRLDAQMRGGKPIVAHSTRHLVRASR